MSTVQAARTVVFYLLLATSACIWGTLSVLIGPFLPFAQRARFITQAWWITLFPGLAIVVLAFGFSLTGDALADMLGVKE